jgi:hypothetical protein
MVFKGRQSLAKVAPNHPFAKPQIGFLPQRGADARKRRGDQETNTVGPMPDKALSERKTNSR